MFNTFKEFAFFIAEIMIICFIVAMAIEAAQHLPQLLF